MPLDVHLNTVDTTGSQKCYSNQIKLKVWLYHSQLIPPIIVIASRI